MSIDRAFKVALNLWGRVYGYDFSGRADLESRTAAVRSKLADKETLIVLDNAEDAARLCPLLPNGRGCAVLLTTRNREWSIALNATTHPVEELSIESGIQLLGQMIQRHGETGRRLGLKISDQAVRTSFEVSWEGLDEAPQAFFPLLTVFEGRSFSTEALAHVAQRDPFDVAREDESGARATISLN
ncbi:MAG: hypothetical protein AAF702_26020 [Chloroflexota bacterium]